MRRPAPVDGAVEPHCSAPRRSARGRGKAKTDDEAVDAETGSGGGPVGSGGCGGGSSGSGSSGGSGSGSVVEGTRGWDPLKFMHVGRVELSPLFLGTAPPTSLPLGVARDAVEGTGASCSSQRDSGAGSGDGENGPPSCAALHLEVVGLVNVSSVSPLAFTPSDGADRVVGPFIASMVSGAACGSCGSGSNSAADTSTLARNDPKKSKSKV